MLLKFHAETKKNQKSKRQQNSLPTSTSLTTMVTRFLHQMTVLGHLLLIPLTNQVFNVSVTSASRTKATT